MKLIKHNKAKTRLMFQNSNNLGDQIITIKDIDGDIVSIKVFYEGSWADDTKLDQLLKASESMPVILTKKLGSEK